MFPLTLTEENPFSPAGNCHYWCIWKFMGGYTMPALQQSPGWKKEAFQHFRVEIMKIRKPPPSLWCGLQAWVGWRDAGEGGRGCGSALQANGSLEVWSCIKHSQICRVLAVQLGFYPKSILAAKWEQEHWLGLAEVCRGSMSAEPCNM